jgi:hypothetical protein
MHAPRSNAPPGRAKAALRSPNPCSPTHCARSMRERPPSRMKGGSDARNEPLDVGIPRDITTEKVGGKLRVRKLQ